MNLWFKMNGFRLGSVYKICYIIMLFLIFFSIIFFVFILLISLFTEWKVSFFICYITRQIFIFYTFLLYIILIKLIIIIVLNISAIFKLLIWLIEFIYYILVFWWNEMLMWMTFLVCILICLITITSFCCRLLWELRRSDWNFIFLCWKLALFKH